MTLTLYKKKRDFRKTPEPSGDRKTSGDGWRFVIQKHQATSLHYDLRLELDGTLKSWAVPKGPSLDPADKRLAIHVEDHPLDYADFEGVIPSGYGAGSVIVWDRGKWSPRGDALADYKRGSLTFELEGDKLRGAWKLVRTRGGASGREQWLFMKLDDDEAKPAKAYSVIEEEPASVISGKILEEMGGPRAVKKSNRAGHGPRGKRSGPRNRDDGVAAQRGAIDPSILPAARAAPRPRGVKPQLAVLGDKVPPGAEWCHEIKFDGYRLLAHLESGQVRLTTRAGLDWTQRFKAVVPGLASLPVKEAILDGEVVILDAQGRSNFQMLQNQLKSKDKRPALVLYLFDIIYCNGFDLTACALRDRKALLERVLAGVGDEGNVRYAGQIVGKGQAVVESACEMGLEGVISKRLSSPYLFARSTDWVKTKCGDEQEFVIVGYTAPKGSRAGFGALLLGVHKDGKTVYSGRVGTGFADAGLRSLHKQLEALRVEEPPLEVPGALRRGVRWVEPRLVAQVKFSGWTDDGRLRHPVFVALREDKSADDIVREKPMKTETMTKSKPSSKTAKKTISKPKKAAAVTIAGVAISHPDRLVYADSGITKQQVAEYYDAAADLMLPHVIDRPLVLLRCPQGAGGACFHQRNLTGSFPPGVVGIDLEDKDGPTTCVAIENRAGLIALIQMGALEIHPWGSRGDNPEQPDQMIFDLDPAADVKWERVVEAAHEIRDLLKQVDFTAFVKTSGGKGLHLVVPLRRKALWPAVKEFAADFVGMLAAAAPHRFVATMSKAKRAGRIFIDHFRNGRGATAVAPYSTRAKPNATVSAPLTWKELTPEATNEQFTLLTMSPRLAASKDAWRGFDDARETLTQARHRAVVNARPRRASA